jgi:nucleotide-binding universal stress UspA family protein
VGVLAFGRATRGETPPAKRKPDWQDVAVATTHCGSGCTLGDLCAEWFVVLVPLSLFGSALAATWASDEMVSFRRILVPVDFSAASDAAWRLAEQLAGRGGTLIALNVVVRPPMPNVAYANIPAALEEQRRENEARMARFAAHDGAETPRVERRVVVGDVADSIVQAARDSAVDLVVIGRTAPEWSEER